MNIDQCIELCHSADLTHPATRANLRDHVLRKLRRERDELAECRRECANGDDTGQWSANWENVGMLQRERQIDAAIRRAEHRLTAVSRGELMANVVADIDRQLESHRRGFAYHPADYITRLKERRARILGHATNARTRTPA